MFIALVNSMIMKCYIYIKFNVKLLTYFPFSIFSLPFLGCKAQKGDQEDPCKTKARVVGDATYCDRYWECINSQPELYDCPNGLVFAGKHRGVTEGIDRQTDLISIHIKPVNDSHLHYK